MVIDNTADYNASSSNTLNNRKIQNFDFTALVNAFDEARARAPRLTGWAASQAMQGALLSNSDTLAFGGELAYQYARLGSLPGFAASNALGTLGSNVFGSAAQSVEMSSTRSGLSLI
jgi:hypothetical protein